MAASVVIVPAVPTNAVPSAEKSSGSTPSCLILDFRSSSTPLTSSPICASSPSEGGSLFRYLSVRCTTPSSIDHAPAAMPSTVAMNSVLPPPTSITSFLPDLSSITDSTPSSERLASSFPVIIVISIPVLLLTSSLNHSRLHALLTTLVAKAIITVAPALSISLLKSSSAANVL